MKYLLAFLWVLVIVSVQGQTQSNLHFSCSFLDDSTGSYWTPLIISKKANMKTVIGKADFSSKFNLHLSTYNVLISLEDNGHELMNIPITYHGFFSKRSNANMSFSFSKTKNTIIEKNVLIYCYPEDFQRGNNYEVSHFIKGVLHCKSNLSKLLEGKTSVVIASQSEFSENSSFQVSIATPQGKIFTMPKFSPKKGINFVDLSTNQNDFYHSFELDNISNKWENRSIYFDQSKYNLKKENIAVLDSIVKYLSKNLNSTIHVMGFTDRVGDAELNSILAEYRAKVVSNYLIKNKIDEKRIIIDWEDSTNKHPIIENGRKLDELRKVVINVN